MKNRLAWALLSLFILVGAAHCRSSASRPEEYLGVIVYLDNQNQYLEGSIEAADIFKDPQSKKLYTAIRFKPTHTPMLFTEDIAFCGNQAEKFNNMTGDIVVTFSKVMHQRDCYDLYMVHQVKEQPLPK